jgi:hypothetical protein
MRNRSNRDKDMKYASLLAMAAATMWLAGCASAPRVAVVDPVGPAPILGASGSGDGSLLIYSAPTPAYVDVNSQEWRLNNDFGKNEFLSEPAHTGYTVYAKTGEVVERVRNARDLSDETPSVVTLHPGAYKVEAKAINCDGTRITVILPVVIKAGQTTVAHLDGGWNPMGHQDTDLAKLPCGRVIGWRAAEGEFASTQLPQTN